MYKNIRIRTSYFVSFLVLFLFSCSSIIEPTIERVEDVNIINMSSKLIELDANMIVLNANNFELDLSSIDLNVLIDSVLIANIKQNYDVVMPSNKEFKMPINIRMDLDKLYNSNPLGALGRGLQIMSDGKLKVLFEGTIKAGKGNLKLTVPIQQEETVLF